MYMWVPLPKDPEEKLCSNILGDGMHIRRIHVEDFGPAHPAPVLSEAESGLRAGHPWDSPACPEGGKAAIFFLLISPSPQNQSDGGFWYCFHLDLSN